MRAAGLTVCVDYAEFLERTLPAWIDGLDDLLVVTAPRDRATREVCDARRVRVCETDVFYRTGSMFNKAGALDEGLSMLGAADWLLLFDADILPPRGWRAEVEAACVAPGCLYSATRVLERGEGVNDSPWEVPGFFHLFHVTDPVVQDRPLFGHWHNASGYDTAFAARWPPSHRRFLPFDVVHLGEVGRNWCGRENHAGMSIMRLRRGLRGGWLHERLP